MQSGKERKRTERRRGEKRGVKKRRDEEEKKEKRKRRKKSEEHKTENIPDVLGFRCRISYLNFVLLSSFSL